MLSYSTFVIEGVQQITQLNLNKQIKRVSILLIKFLHKDVSFMQGFSRELPFKRYEVLKVESNM